MNSLRFAIRRLVRLASAAGVLLAAVGVGRGADPLFNQTVVFSSGDGYPVFRIPAIVSSSFGTLLAFAEGRPTTNDLGENDIVLKRSLDDGATWQTMQVPLSHDLAGVPTRGFNNPTPVVDQASGDILLFATRPALSGSGNYFDVFVTRSADDGVTWSAPTNISAAIRPDDDKYITAGPGHAIQLSSGRIVVPYYSRNLNDGSLSGESRVFYSDDHGATWQQGGEVPKPALFPGQTLPVSIIEPQIVETENGLYMNMRTRNYGPSFNRAYAFSADGGLTWSTAEIDPTLIDSNTQGSVARWTTEAVDGTNRILLSNTYSTAARENLVVQTSYDEGLSWDNLRTITFGRAAYSDLGASADGTMNLLYENGRAGDPRYATVNQYQQITLARFNTEWLETPQVYTLRYDFAEQALGTTVSRADAGIQDSAPWLLHAEVEPTLGDLVYVQGSDRTDGSAVRLSGDSAILLRNSASQHFFDVRDDGDFTIEAILRTTEHGAGGTAGAGMIMGRGPIVDPESVLYAPHWYMQILDGKLNFSARDADGNQIELTGTRTISDGEWHSLAAVRDASNELVYLLVDGVTDGSVYFPLGSFNALGQVDNAWIGMSSAGNRFLQADLDMVRFSRATPDMFEIVNIPEPGALVLTAAGLAAWQTRRLRRRKTA